MAVTPLGARGPAGQPSGPGPRRRAARTARQAKAPPRR